MVAAKDSWRKVDHLLSQPGELAESQSIEFALREVMEYNLHVASCIKSP